MSEYVFYVGSFDDRLSVCSFNSETEEISLIKNVEHKFRPAQLALSADKKVLYTANENSDGVGGVSSYDIRDSKNPVLTGDVKPGNHGPAYAAVTKDKKFLVGASFFDGVAELFSLNEDGSVKELVDTYQFTTTGTARNDGAFGQFTPRCHCAFPLKNSDFIAITDYSGDRLVLFDVKSGKFELISEIAFESGNAMRLIADCPFRDDLYYVLAEYGSLVYAVKIDPNGKMEIISKCSTLEESKIENSTAAIKTTADGKYMYVTNRGYDNIAVFEISNNGESLERIGFVRVGVGYSRDYSITPDGKYMLVASMFEGKIWIHKMNYRTGMPEPLGKCFDISLPTNISFAD